MNKINADTLQALLLIDLPYRLIIVNISKPLNTTR